MTINPGPVSYHKNSIDQNTPSTATEEEGGYVHYQEKVDGRKVQRRSDSFKDHFSQARLFWDSMTKLEKEHIIEAFSFELGKVQSKDIKQQVVNMFADVSQQLAVSIADAIGVKGPKDVKESSVTKSSLALSQEANPIKGVATRKIAVLAGNGFNGKDVSKIMKEFEKAGTRPEIVSDKQGFVKGDDGTEMEVSHTFLTADSVLFDAVYAAGGLSADMKAKKEAVYFINEAFDHFKTVGASHDGIDLSADLPADTGVVTEASPSKDFADTFLNALAEHRHWNRQVKKQKSEIGRVMKKKRPLEDRFFFISIDNEV